jgi:hypothetical protein
MKVWCALNFCLCIFLGGADYSLASPMTREQALLELRAIKTQNATDLGELDIRLKSMLAAKATPIEGVNMIAVEALAQTRQEMIWRQELYDRLILQVDTRFRTGQDLRLFLSDRLTQMAHVDLTNTATGQHLWKQFTRLSQALRDLTERDENIIGFISGYIKISPFQNPLKSDDYLKNRNYTNGRESLAAHPVAKESVSENVSERVNEIETSKK